MDHIFIQNERRLLMSRARQADREEIAIEWSADRGVDRRDRMRYGRTMGGMREHRGE